MPRRSREDAPNAVHHVIQRGNNRNYIYEDTRDKRQFLTLLGTAVITYDAVLLQYVLMDNHYHLLVRVGGRPLAQLIWFLNRSYTMYYNHRYNRIGTIYGGRYKSYLMEDSYRFYSTVRYIVRNPVKAGLAATPAQYRWSGHSAVLTGASGVVDRPALLSFFSPDADLALKRYVECTESDAWSAQVGSATILDPKNETEERLTCILDRLLSKQNSPIDRKTLAAAVKPALPRDLRNTFILLAITDGHALKDIAAFLHLSHETVRRIGKLATGRVGD